DLEQVEREKIMSAFKNKSVKILIGTDIISRGIDVVGIELVINYDTPSDPEDYVHRVGRTARADMEGEAITFVNPKDQYKFDNIEKLIGMKVTQNPLPEGFEAGPSYTGTASKGKSDFGSKKNAGFSKNKKSSNGGKKKPFPKRENSNSSQAKPANPKPIEAKKPTEPKVSAEPKPVKSGKFGMRKNVIDPE
ncbi:C-terminal helicase domain-containing protein, partial [Algoriphagus sp.]